jgi:hypothetical protein
MSRTVAYRESDVTDEYGLMPWVPIGAKVRLEGGWIATITEEGKACDCGKGVYCPLIPQVKK